MLAGAIFVAFGGAFAYTASTYEVGSLLSMGPGYFPLVLGGILAALGLVIAMMGLVSLRREAAAPALPAEGRREVNARPEAGDQAGVPAGVQAGVQAGDRGKEPEPEERGSVPWGRAGLLLLAIVFFGFTVDGLGLAPTLLVTVFLAAMAGRGTRWRTAALISIGLTALSIAVFVLLLQLRIPLVGPWLGG